MKSKRVILDTNLWISFLISKKFNQIDSLVASKTIVFVFSHESLEEFLTVIKRPKLINLITDSDIHELIRQFDNYGKLVKVKSSITLCRDPKDNFLLNLAVDSKADYLVTGDADLLVLKTVQKTRICKWNEFLLDLQ